MKKYIRSSERLCEEKQTLRREKARQTESLSAEYIEESNRVIIDKLLSLDKLKNAETVFLYYSVGREVSTEKLIDRLLREGRRIALPVCEGSGVMSFYPVKEKTELRPGRFGIAEPRVTQPLTPCENDIIIVPALCCDRYGNRLGHGMGYYDRYLAKTDVFSVSLCRKALMEDKLPTEDTDKAVSLVLTD